MKDHQGNVRVVADKDGNVEETNAYYPFGGTFTSTNSIQPYMYNGKELDTRNGLNWYDYEARHYDVVIGRWHIVDTTNGDTDPTVFQYNVVRWAADNGVNGNENVYQNMFRGYLQIVKDPMNWIPTPLDPTNLIPKSWYTISSPWNRFQMLNRGKYTIENYGTHQNALKNRSLDYQKWKQ